MSIAVGNVVVGTDTFDTVWVKQNQIATALSNVIVTLAPNTAGGLTSGNGSVNGIFAANTLITNALSGGVIGTSANLNITSNVTISCNITSSANINTSGDLIVSGIANITGNVVFSANLTVSGNTYTGNIIAANTSVNTLSVSNVSTFQTNFILDGYANSNLGSSLSTPLVIYTFANTSYTAGKFLVYAKNGNNVLAAEMLVAQGNGAAVLTTYALLATAPAANLGIFGSQINVSSYNIEITFSQNIASTSIKLSAQMLV